VTIVLVATNRRAASAEFVDFMLGSVYLYTAIDGAILGISMRRGRRKADEWLLFVSGCEQLGKQRPTVSSEASTKERKIDFFLF